MNAPISPGWYRDPYGTPGLLRWWDGNQWTQATQPADEWDDEGTSADHTSADQGPAAGQPWAQPPQGADQQPWAQPQWAQPQWAPEPGGDPGWGQQPQQPWTAPRQGGGTGNRRLLWGLLGGGGFLLAAGLVVVVLFVTGVIGGGDGAPSPASTATNAARSPVVGTINDTSAGLSYPQLGGPWQASTVEPGDFLGQLGFAMGEIAVVQENYQDGNPYLATAYSGRLAESIRYEGTGDMENAADDLLRAMQPRAYPPHNRRDIESKAYTVSGKRAWLLRSVLDFPDAEANGWNFTSETAVIVLVDRGESERPGVYYLSFPDSHENQGDLDLLLGSLKAE